MGKWNKIENPSKECPSCLCKRVGLWQNDAASLFFAECESCELQGPLNGTAAGAIEALRRLADEMQAEDCDDWTPGAM